MKSLTNILLICLMSIFLCSSCAKVSTYEYIILNDTKHTIIIESYDRDTDGIYDGVIQIEPNSEYILLKELTARGMSRHTVFKSSYIDSVVINFDNEKMIIQSCEEGTGYKCDIERNIMNIGFSISSDWIWKEVSKNHDSYTYTITEEDYDRAVPLGID